MTRNKKSKRKNNRFPVRILILIISAIVLASSAYFTFLSNSSSITDVLGTQNLKPFPQGLVVTNPADAKQYPFMKYVTIKSLDWSDFETSPGVYQWSVLDNALNTATSDLKVRLRIYAGSRAPSWLNGISGSCVNTVADSANGGTGCVHRFWTDEYIARYNSFVQALGARYSSNPKIVDVINSACTTIFAEPFILGADSASKDALWQAGLRDYKHEKCIRDTTASMATNFPTTRVTLAGHSKWQLLAQGPGGPSDAKSNDSWPAERSLLNDLISQYGKQLIIEEHGLDANDYCAPGQNLSSASTFYCWFSSLNQPKGLQFTLNGTSMEAAANNGVNMGACFLEFAAFQAIPASNRENIHNMLVNNCVGLLDAVLTENPVSGVPSVPAPVVPPVNNPVSGTPTTPLPPPENSPALTASQNNTNSKISEAPKTTTYVDASSGKVIEVAIIESGNEASIKQSQHITLNPKNLNENSDKILKVEYFVNGELWATVDVPPFVLSAIDLPRGESTIREVTYFKDGTTEENTKNIIISDENSVAIWSEVGGVSFAGLLLIIAFINLFNLEIIPFKYLNFRRYINRRS